MCRGQLVLSLGLAPCSFLCDGFELHLVVAGPFQLLLQACDLLVQVLDRGPQSIALRTGLPRGVFGALCGTVCARKLKL